MDKNRRSCGRRSAPLQLFLDQFSNCVGELVYFYADEIFAEELMCGRKLGNSSWAAQIRWKMAAGQFVFYNMGAAFPVQGAVSGRKTMSYSLCGFEEFAQPANSGKALMDENCKGKQDRAGEKENVFHTEECCDKTAENGTCYGTYLLRGEEEAEDLPLGIGRAVMCEKCIDGGVDACKKETADKLHDSKGAEIIRNSLEHDSCTCTAECKHHGADEAATLPESSPSRCRYCSGDAAERKDEAGNKDEVW